MLQADEPDAFAFAYRSSSSITVRDLLDETFTHLGLDWEDHVALDERYVRPAVFDADVEAITHEGPPWIDSVSLPSWGKK